MSQEITYKAPATDWQTLAYWEGCGRGELVLQRCSSCDRVQHRPRGVCAHCLSSELEHFVASGRGVVYSCTVIHQNGIPPFRDACGWREEDDGRLHTASSRDAAHLTPGWEAQRRAAAHRVVESGEPRRLVVRGSRFGRAASRDRETESLLPCAARATAARSTSAAPRDAPADERRTR